MNNTSLDTLAAEDLARAKEHNWGWSAHTVYGGQGSALRRLGTVYAGEDTWRAVLVATSSFRRRVTTSGRSRTPSCC